MDDDGMVETTEEHFATFRDEVTALWEELGITSWDLLVIHGTHPDDQAHNAAAACGFMPDQRRIIVTLAKQVSGEDLVRLKRMAHHEVAHAFLAPLENAARDRYMTEPEIDAASHEVVHRLVGLFKRLET